MYIANRPLTEKEIQGQILNFLAHIGVFCWRNNSVGVFDQRKNAYRKRTSRHQINGVPDILGIMHGKFLAIEVKRHDGKVSDAQRIFLAKMNDEGGVAFVARSLGQTISQLISIFPEDKVLAHYGKQYLCNDKMNEK